MGRYATATFCPLYISGRVQGLRPSGDQGAAPLESWGNALSLPAGLERGRFPAQLMGEGVVVSSDRSVWRSAAWHSMGVTMMQPCAVLYCMSEDMHFIFCRRRRF